MNFIAELAVFMLRAGSPLGIDISDKQLEVGVSSLKVRASKPSFAAAIERMPCSSAWHHAALVLPCCPTLVVISIRRKMTTCRACWLTQTPCFRAPCEVAGRFILAAKEDPARKRRHQSAMAGSGVDTVDTLVLPCDFGVVRGRFARVNGCSVGLYSRPGECLVCQSTPWTRYMHVETVPNVQNDVRFQQLSPRRRRGINPT